MKKTLCISALTCLVAGACATQPAEKASEWRHASQTSGGACSAPRAPEKAVIENSVDITAKRLLGRWENGSWAKSDGRETGHCVNISVISVDPASGQATLYFGYSGGEKAEFVMARYGSGIISHITNAGQKYWISVDETNHMKIEFRDTDGTFYATLKPYQ